MAPQVSVIVPIHNVAPYLARCLDSLRAQTFEDFEALLVDDGSTDDSLRVCEEYCTKDTRFKVVSKVNGGAASARNAGIEAAGGQFLAFVDGDDSIDPRMLMVLSTSLADNQTDIAVCDYYNVYGSRTVVQYGHEEHFVCDASTAFGYFLIGDKTGASVCTKLFRRSALAGLSFEEGNICEDALFLSELFFTDVSVSFELLPLYYYHHRQKSISTRSYNEKSLDTTKVYTGVYERIVRDRPALQAQALFRLEWAHFFVFDQMLVNDDYAQLPGYKGVKSFLRGHAIHVVSNVWFRRGRRMAAAALLVGVPLYRFLLKRNLKRVWQDE